MDKIDRVILEILQKDFTRPVGDIADQISLGNTACWRRIQEMEESGVIRARVALLDGKKLNVGVIVFVSIKTAQHNADWLDKFHEAVSGVEEVVEVYRMAGDTDYLLRVAVPDVSAYDGVYKQLIRIPGISDISSSFAMEQIKYSTSLPLLYPP
ncbi:Lrp/AsnC family transcriptional regulator [Pseudomonas syringae pv. syringae]|nr:Lrp/AsnC family transcriptional regulator [Pseudomonas syringae pv. syringae]